MLPSWLRQFKKRLGGQGARTPKQARIRFFDQCTLGLEGLEDRVTPGVATWTGGGIVAAGGVLVSNPAPGVFIHNARWSNPLNWSGGPPQPGDDVVFPIGNQIIRSSGSGPTFVWAVNSEVDLYTDPVTGVKRNFDINNLTILDDNYHIDYFPGDVPSPPLGSNDPESTPQLTIRGEIRSFIQTGVAQPAGALLVGVTNNVGESLIGPLVPGATNMSILLTGSQSGGPQSLRADGPGVLKIGVPLMESPLSGGRPVGLQKNGPGLMMLGTGGAAGAGSTLRGDITVNEGTLLFSNINSLGTADRGTFVNSGATLGLAGATLPPGVPESMRIIGDGVNNLDASVGGPGSGTIVGALYGGTDPSGAFSGGAFGDGSGGLIAGDVNLQASASVSGGLTITGRVTGGGDLTVLRGSLTLANNDEYTGRTNILTGATVNIRANQALGLPNLPTDDPNLTGTIVSPGGTLNIIGDLSVPENLILNGGTLGLISPAARAFWLGTITVNATSNFRVVNSNTLNDFNTTQLTLSGEMSGSGGINKIDQGRVRIARPNPSFAGTTLVSDGVLQIADPLALGPAGGGGGVGAVTVTTPGTNVQGTLRIEGNYAFDKELFLNGLGFNSDGALRIIQNPANSASNITLTGNVHLASESSVNVDPISTLTSTGVIDGSVLGNLSKIGQGTLIFASDNAYLGGTSVDAGTLLLASPGGLGLGTLNGGRGTQVGRGATLRLTGPLDVVDEDLTITGQGVNALGAFQVPAGQSSWGGLITLNGIGSSEGDISVDAGGSINFTNVLSGNADLRKLGAGAIILSGSAPNTFVRTTFIDQGAILLGKDAGLNALSGTIIVGDANGGNNADVLQLVNSEQIPNTASVLVRESGLFDLANNNETLGGLNAISVQGGEVSTGTGVLTSGGLNGAVSVGGSAEPSRLSGTFNLGGVTRVFAFAATPPLSLRSSRNISTFGSSITFTVVASPNPGVSTPTGAVQFFDNGVLFDTRQLVGGVAQSTPDALPTPYVFTPGTHVVTASYLGDGTYPPVSITLSPNQLIVNPLAQTVLSSNLNPASPIQPVTFSFRVIDPLNANTPTGTAEFFDTFGGATTSLGVVPLSLGSASLQVPSLLVGQHVITANYSGDTIFAPSITTLSPNLQVGTTPVGNLNSDSSPALRGQTVTFTYQAQATGGGVIPTGTVEFFANGVSLGTAALNANGMASLPVAFLNVGTFNVTANYSGDSFYVPSISTLSPQLLVANPLVGRITVNTDPQIVGQNMIATVQLNGLPGQPAPMGSITLRSNGASLGSFTLTPQPGVGGNPFSSVAIPFSLAAGGSTITADFTSSNFNYLAQTNIATLPVPAVFVASTTPLILSTSNNASISNNGVSSGVFPFNDDYAPNVNDGIQLRVRSASAFGTIRFFVDNVQVVDANGQPVVINLNQVGNVSTLPNPLDAVYPRIDPNTGLPATLFPGGPALDPPLILPAGTHTIRADFSPSPGSPVGATSVTLTPGQVVRNPIDGILLANTSQAALTNPVTFTYLAVTPIGIGLPTATGGTVTFRDGANVLGVAPLLVDPLTGFSTAKVSTVNLGTGARNITATYSGNSAQGYGPETEVLSPPLVVSNNPLQATLTSSVNAAREKDLVTFTYTALGNVGQQPPTGTVTFFDTYTDNANPPLTFRQQIGNVQNLIGSTASVDTATLRPGTHLITAQYDPYPGELVYSSSVTTLAPIQIILTPVTTQFFSDAPFDPTTIRPTQQVGTNVTFTTNLTTTFDPVQPTTPTGTVQFFDVFTDSMGTTTRTSLGIVILPPTPLAPPSPPVGTPPPQVPPPPPVTMTQTAQVSTAALALGTHRIEAVYSGDFRYEPTTLAIGNLDIVPGTPPPVSLPATVISARQPNATVDAAIIGSAAPGNPNPGIIKSGVGTLTLNGLSSYTGATTSGGAGGTIIINSTNALPTSTDLIINAGTVDLNGLSQVVGSLSGAAPGILAFTGGGNLIAGSSGTSTTYAGRISGTGTLTKVGLGTLTLTGPGTGGTIPNFTGTTNVTAGTVLVNSNQSTATVAVQSGATLGGTGTVGTVNVFTGGTVAPGTTGAVGTLTAGAVTFNGGAFTPDLAKSLLGVFSSDRLAASSVFIPPGAPNPFLRLGTSLYNNMVLTDPAFTILTSVATIPSTFRFNKLNQDGTPARDAMGNLVPINDGDNVVVGGRAYQIRYNANNVTAEFVGLVPSVPSPSSNAFTVTPNPSNQGQTVTISVRFDRATPSDPVPVGTVTFSSMPSVTFSPVILNSDANGLIATTTATFPALGNYNVTATFNPTDGRYLQTSVSYTQMVNVATTTTVSASTNSAAFGQSVTFTATVTSSGGGTPTGAVTFVNLTTGQTLGTVGLNGSGQASLTTSTLPSGANAIRAVYSGDPTFRSSFADVGVTVAPKIVPPYYTNAFVIGGFLVLQGNGVPGGTAILPVPPGTSALFTDINGDGKGDVILILPNLVAILDGQTGRPLALLADVDGDGAQNFLLFNADGSITRVF